MSEVDKQAAGAAEIAASIRDDSAQLKLSSASLLAERFPETDIEGTLAEASQEFPDIAKVQGAVTPYRYSTLSISETYATHLARVEDNDPLRLMAETVRDNSRIYPRPTEVRFFSESPFFLSPSDVASVLLKLGSEPETSDIKSCKASNGAVYLYSDRFLTEAHAQGLTEYYEVERWQNY